MADDIERAPHLIPLFDRLTPEHNYPVKGLEVAPAQIAWPLYGPG